MRWEGCFESLVDFFNFGVGIVGGSWGGGWIWGGWCSLGGVEWCCFEVFVSKGCEVWGKGCGGGLECVFRGLEDDIEEVKRLGGDLEWVKGKFNLWKIIYLEINICLVFELYSLYVFLL